MLFKQVLPKTSENLESPMTSSRPYFIRAIYEWLADNKLTPYLSVNTDILGVQVPQHFVKNGQITLNISSEACGKLRIGNEAVEFHARFLGVSYHIFIPIHAIRAIYAFENGRGMLFEDEDYDDKEDDHGSARRPTTKKFDSSPSPKRKKGPPDLRIIK